MTIYSKETVATLRNILKERGIPSTGLTRKQQIIERLEQDDVEKTQGSGLEQLTALDEEQQESPSTIGNDGPTSDAASSVTIPAEGSLVDTHGKRAGTAVQQQVPIESHEEPEVEDNKDTSSQPKQNISENPRMTLSVSQTPVPTNECVLPEVGGESVTPTSATPAPELAQQNLASTATSTAPSTSRIGSQELVEDSKKRKRRSVTPQPSADDVERKKARQLSEVSAEEHFKEDVTMNETSNAALGQSTLNQDQRKTDVEILATELTQGHQSSADVQTTEKAETAGMSEGQEKLEVDAQDISKGGEPDELSPQQIISPAASKLTSKDSRYKNLFPTSSTVPEPVDTAVERNVPPALHPATPALYIKNLMRPLQEKALQAHLVSLASQPQTDPDSSVLRRFHLDSYRTHCLVLFNSISQASRVRGAIHQSVFPNESSRKPLWADFVPEEHIVQWISMEEEDARESRRGMGKKWEVIYVSDADGETSALFQEAGGHPANTSQVLHNPRATHEGTRADAAQFKPTPSAYPGRRTSVGDDGVGIHPSRRALVDAPAAERQRPKLHSSNQLDNRQPDTEKPFLALDALFSSTATKPKLYFQPAPQALAKKRIEEIDAVFGDSPRESVKPKPGDLLRKWSFLGGDQFRDCGELFRPDRRGGGRGRGGGGGRGGDFYRR